MLNALAQALIAGRRHASAVPTPAWRGGLLCAGALLLAACGGGHAKAPAATALLALPSIVLGPADLANAYHMQSQQYLDDDAHPASSPTKQYRRVLSRNDATSGAADLILITVTDSGVENASDFIDSASDDDTGPPNLQDYIASVVIGASNVHATPFPDFPSSDDATVANQLTWQQDVNGVPETEFAYGVYVRQQGLLAFISVRAATTGGEPDGLRKQAEDVVKKQADKLKQGAASAQRDPGWPRGGSASAASSYLIPAVRRAASAHALALPQGGRAFFDPCPCLQPDLRSGEAAPSPLSGAAPRGVGAAPVFPLNGESFVGGEGTARPSVWQRNRSGSS